MIIDKYRDYEFLGDHLHNYESFIRKIEIYKKDELDRHDFYISYYNREDFNKDIDDLVFLFSRIFRISNGNEDDSLYIFSEFKTDLFDNEYYLCGKIINCNWIVKRESDFFDVLIGYSEKNIIKLKEICKNKQKNEIQKKDIKIFENLIKRILELLKRINSNVSIKKINPNQLQGFPDLKIIIETIVAINALLIVYIFIFNKLQTFDPNWVLEIIGHENVKKTIDFQKFIKLEELCYLFGVLVGFDNSWNSKKK